MLSLAKMYFNPISKIDCVEAPRHSLSSLYKDYITSPNLFCGYTSIAQNLKISKAKLKRIKKFRKEILRDKVITNQPLCERLNILFQSLNKQNTSFKISKEINLISSEQANLPYANIIFGSKRQNKNEQLNLIQCLVDSGSEVSICTAKMLEHFNTPRKCISKTCGTMNIITSNSFSTNCILGTINVDVFLLTKDINNNVFGKSKNVKFYVAKGRVQKKY